MIFDTLKRRESYVTLGPHFARAFAFLESVAGRTWTDGRVEVDEDRVFAMFSTYTTRLADEVPYESHRVYADIQYMVEGEEIIRVVDTDLLEPDTDYNADRDILFYRRPEPGAVTAPGMAAPTDLLLRPGCFTILFPHDAHAPTIAAHRPATVRKVVVKVEL